MEKAIQDMSTQELNEAYNADTQSESQVPESSDALPEADSSAKVAKIEPVEELDPAKKAEEEARLAAERERLIEEERNTKFWAKIRAERDRKREVAQRKLERREANAAIEAAKEAEIKKIHAKAAAERKL